MHHPCQVCIAPLHIAFTSSVIRGQAYHYAELYWPLLRETTVCSPHVRLQRDTPNKYLQFHIPVGNNASSNDLPVPR